MNTHSRISILGTGNIGGAIAHGLAVAGRFHPDEVILTRRHVDRLVGFADRGFQVQSDNVDAVRRAALVIIAVEPQQLDRLLDEISPGLDAERHGLISVVSGASIEAIVRRTGKPMHVIRAMPNIAIALGQSMTCLATNSDRGALLERCVSIFDAMGTTRVIDEEQMVPATALCACGLAFFLRAIRAASQGGIEIGFHPDEALMMAAQTALGAASLVLQRGRHPESEIDAVTTPRGCTIAGLNEMEHRGFGSAMIRGIVTSANKAGLLYDDK